MDSTQRNPLSGYFRQPVIYLKLPSNGRWWKEGSLNLTESGDLPVYPMSLNDEIMLKTPDALMNGQGIVNVIQSCIPNITSAWDMPSIDVDTVLIALRIASFGNNMEFDSRCPHCQEENTHEVDLTIQLQNLAQPDFTEAVAIGKLRIKLKPQSYFNTNRGDNVRFEEERLVNALNMPEATPSEEKAKLLEESMKRLTELGIRSIANSTEYIEIDGDERVSNMDFLTEFYTKSDASVIHTIQERLAQINEVSKLKPLQLQCNECSKPYNIDLTFDYASFFGKSS
jgi:hypothetical protein